MKYHSPFLPEKIYHIYNHAVGSEYLFREEANYIHFLNLIGKYIFPISDIIAYNLLPNHFHVILRINDKKSLAKRYFDLKQKNIDENFQDWSKFISQQFSNCCNAYAKAYNKRFIRRGALFIDYLKRKKVNNNKYLINLIKYVHYNAVHHEICNNIDNWFWSSYQTIISENPSKISKNIALVYFDNKERYFAHHNNVPVFYKDEFEFL